MFVYLFLILPLCLLTYLYSSSSVSPLKRNEKKEGRSTHFFLNPPLALPFSSAALIAMNLVTHVFHQLMSMERAASPGDSR